MIRLFVGLFLTITVWADMPSAVAGAIQSNPQILQSHEGQALLQQQGIAADTIQKALDNTQQDTQTTSTADQPTQNIDQKTPSESESKPATPLNHSAKPPRNPLTYLSHEQLLSGIMSLQQDQSSTKGLTYFGYNFFSNRNQFDPSSMPTPDYYLLSPGDQLSVWLYGTTNENYLLTIDSNGDIQIPLIGPKHIAGMEFAKACDELKNTFEKTYPGAKASVTMAKYSTIQVTLTGEAKAPGIYNLPSLATIQVLLIEAQGILPTGSLRNIEIYRNGNLYKITDLYRLLGGKPEKEVLLRTGDTIKINRAAKQVSLFGEAKKPAIYELKRDEQAKALLRYSGGLTPQASAEDIVVKRFIDNIKTQTYHMTLAEFKTFTLVDGDEVYIYSLDAAKQDNYYVFGSIFNPGPRALPATSRSLHRLFQNEAKQKLDQLFLPDTYFDYAYIKRRTETLGEKIISFNPKDVYRGKADVTLQKEDEIYFLNKYDIMASPFVKIEGQVLKPGMYRYFEGLKLSDVVIAAGISSLIDRTVQLTTYATPNNMPKSITLDIKNNADYLLHPSDEIYLFDYYTTHEQTNITIKGEVVKPGNYPIDGNTTLAEIINSAGGLTGKASSKAELIRYFVHEGQRKRKIETLDLQSTEAAKVLKAYDEITIFRIPNWRDPRSVTIEGEVLYPGTYMVNEGDTLASLIRRAGGFTKTAFVQGTVFTRESIKAMQRKQLQKSLEELKKNVMVVAAEPADIGTSQSSLQQLLIGIDELIKEAQDAQPIGRVTLNISKDIQALQASENNIILENGDTIYVPTKNDTISVLGEVLNPTALVYRKNDSPWDYIERTGGLTKNADDDSIIIIHANGEAERLDGGLFVISTPDIYHGDTIVVPIEIKTYSQMKIAKDIAQILYQLALTVAAANAVGVL